MEIDSRQLWLTEELTDISILLSSEGLLYGAGLFETCYFNKGSIEDLPLHLDRLTRGANALGIPIPEVLASAMKLEQQLVAFATGLEASGPLALRINLVKIESGSSAWVTTRAVPYTKDQYMNGLRLKSNHCHLNATDLITSFKTTNYLKHWHARRQSIGLDCDELLWVNGQGCVSEGTVSNIFFVKNNRWHTPHSNCGLLAGIMRKKLIVALNASGLAVVEGYYSLEDIFNSDQVYLTNALMGLMPVQAIDQHRFKVNEKSLHKVFGMLGIKRYE